MDNFTEVPIENPQPPHYYGNHVRRLFVLAGAIMVITYAFFANFIQEPVFLSIFAILLLALLAGFQGPRAAWIMVLNTVVAVIGCAVFEYRAVVFYRSVGFFTNPIYFVYFALTQALALIFFFAIYFSSKTVRGTILKNVA